MKHAALLLLVGLFAWSGSVVESSATDVSTRGVPRPVAGEVLTLRFLELGPMHDGLPAACEVSVPKSYDRDRPAPLLVWFGGGRGSHSVGGATGLADFDRFVVVALPYPEGRNPRVAAEELRVEEHWDYHRVMLERVHAILPNLDPRLRVAAGTSNGAHYLAYGLDQRWPGFGDAFTAFVLHEGGAAPLSSAISGAKGRMVLVAWGTRSESLWWREWFNDRIAVVGADLTLAPIPGAGHGLNDDGRKVIREWIDARMNELE